MARKPKHEEHENHERWLISYADFITLLFAFFVVMYSVSSVNEGKYRVLSDALVAAFRAPAKSMAPIQTGQTAKSPAGVQFSIRKSPAVIKTFDRPLPSPHSKDDQKEKAAQLNRQTKSQAQAQTQSQSQSQTKANDHGQAQAANEAAAAIQKMADEVEHAMQSLIKQGMINVRRSTFWLEVEINTSILYSSGSARLESDSIPVLEELAKILTPFPNALHVEGFTDNVPINTLTFPSNWELSAARAASVVTLFARAGIDPARLAAIGYGQYRPVADNDTAQGRTKNRRVVVVVMSSADKHEVAPGAAPQQVKQQLNAPPADGAAPTEQATPTAPAAPTAPTAASVATTPHVPGEPIDVTSQPVTEVGHFPIIALPIAAPAEHATPKAPAVPVATTPHVPGEPIDITSQPVTEVGRFPIIDLPIAVPLPARAAPAAK
jgi:chemotaxis protein MotB